MKDILVLTLPTLLVTGISFILYHYLFNSNDNSLNDDITKSIISGGFFFIGMLFWKISEKIGIIAKPDELIFLKELPKLDNGKIDRGLLREKAKEGLKELTGKESEHQRILEKLREDYQKIYFE